MTTVKKTAIVTGAGKRMGAEIAVRLARLGYHTVLHCNTSKKEAENLAVLIRAEGGGASVYPCDLADEKAITWMIPNIHKDHPGLTLLINNASIFEPSSFLTSTNESFNHHMDINFKAPYILMREFAKVCPAGAIINILDTDIIRNATEHFTYLLSKKALAQLTTMTALELAPSIRVNGICPGLILSPAGKDVSYLEKKAENVPAKAHGSPEDVIRAVEFLLNNSFITGQNINVDGGEHLN